MNLEALMKPEQFERVSDLMQLKPAYSAGALLGNSSRQVGDLGEFPVAKYTPGVDGDGIEPLTGANMAASIVKAYEAAVDAGGGTVLVPAGHWQLNDDDECHFTTTHDFDNIKIRGAGMDLTVLELPVPYTHTLFKFSGEASPGSFYTNGGIEDMSINCLGVDVGNTGCGVHIESTVNTQFRNLTIRNFAGGTGFKARRVGGDGTNQYTQFWNVTCASNGVNFDWKSLINAQACGLYANAGIVRDLLCDDVKCSIYGGNFQSSAPVRVELAGEGGCRLVLYDFYWEGFGGTLFKMNSPSVTFNALAIHGFQVGGSPAIFADVDAFNDLFVSDAYGIGNADTILKGRNGAHCVLVNSGSILSSPSKFDLDATTAGGLVCLGSGLIQYFGERVVANRGFGLPGYAPGAEPASPVAGDIIRCTTHDRPSMRGSSSWKRVAYTSDESDLSALLAPYCTEIFDPRVRRLRSVISGEIDTLTGLLNGTVLSAPGAGQRPTWNSSDEFFGGNPSLSCAFSGDHFLAGTLAVPVVTASRPGVVAVFRANVAGVDSNRRFPFYLTNTTRETHIFLGYGDFNDASRPYVYYAQGVGSGSIINGPTSLDVFGHAAFITSDPLDSLQLDSAASITGSDNGTTQAALNNMHIGAAWDGGAYVGCDVSVAYLAILKQTLPLDLKDRVNKLVMSRFGLR